MIQRIQSIFLLISGVLAFVALYSPMSHFYEGFKFSTDIGNFFNTHHFSFLISGLLVKLAGVLALVAIFLFKKRVNQIRLINLSNILIFAWILFSIYCFVTIPISAEYKSIGKYLSKYYTIFIPFLMLIFNFLAKRKIKSDEDLVKSMDRLR